MNETMQVGLAQASALFLTFLPKLLLAIAIFVVGYFVGKMICKGLNHVLERVGFNRLIERGGVKQTLDRSGWEASQILSKIVFYFVMLFVLQLSFGVFGPNPISAILTGIIAFLPNVFAAVVIAILAAAFAGGAKQMISAALASLSYGRIVANAAAIAILVVGLSAALDQLHIAPAIVDGLFYAILAVVAGTLIVAVGGGGIAPMQKRWEQALGRMEQEAPRIKEATSGASDRMQAEAEAWQQRATTTLRQANTPPAAGERPVSAPPSEQRRRGASGEGI